MSVVVIETEGDGYVNRISIIHSREIDPTVVIEDGQTLSRIDERLGREEEIARRSSVSKPCCTQQRRLGVVGWEEEEEVGVTEGVCVVRLSAAERCIEVGDQVLVGRVVSWNNDFVIVDDGYESIAIHVAHHAVVERSWAAESNALLAVVVYTRRQLTKIDDASLDVVVEDTVHARI